MASGKNDQANNGVSLNPEAPSFVSKCGGIEDTRENDNHQSDSGRHFSYSTNNRRGGPRRGYRGREDNSRFSTRTEPQPRGFLHNRRTNDRPEKLSHNHQKASSDNSQMSNYDENNISSSAIQVASNETEANIRNNSRHLKLHDSKRNSHEASSFLEDNRSARHTFDAGSSRRNDRDTVAQDNMPNGMRKRGGAMMYSNNRYSEQRNRNFNQNHEMSRGSTSTEYDHSESRSSNKTYTKSWKSQNRGRADGEWRRPSKQEDDFEEENETFPAAGKDVQKYEKAKPHPSVRQRGSTSIKQWKSDDYNGYGYSSLQYSKSKNPTYDRIGSGASRCRDEMLDESVEESFDDHRSGNDREFKSLHDRVKSGKSGKEKENTVKLGTANQRELLEGQLETNSYECMVCCSSIKKDAAIWSCDQCYHMFHLYCIKKWANSCISKSSENPLTVPSNAPQSREDSGAGDAAGAAGRSAEGTSGVSGSWRCPACQILVVKFPSRYLCFCGKQVNPDFSHHSIPHSCGEICSRKRGDNCKHPCNILCHPGPCPPCSAYVKTQCQCGRLETTVKCSDNINIKCQNVCDNALNCGRHKCDRVCHKGPCSPCEAELEQICFCGQYSRKVNCGSAESSCSFYCCGNFCNKLLDCGNHSCDKFCHEGPCGACLLSPELATRCPCGKMKLSELSAGREVTKEEKVMKKKKKGDAGISKGGESSLAFVGPRTSCLDPLPCCTSTCNKPLDCVGDEEFQHRCKKTCHNGKCPECDGKTSVKCQCGSTSKKLSCKELKQMFEKDQKVKCDRKCNAKLMCLRHKCHQSCCVDQEHLCKVVCGRKLGCNLHKCEEPCHRNNCAPCWRASFDELTCTCGAEVIYPPVACGTKPPDCHNLCTREHTCNHKVMHHCHSEPSCPPCAILTEKTCMCGREKRSSIACHLTNISCGRPCGKQLPCIVHQCQRLCHKGICLDEGNPKCIQPCPARREECGHPCKAPCHVGKPCPPTQCKTEVVVRCDCGLKTKKMLCLKAQELSSKDDYNKFIGQMIASQLWNSQSIDLAALKEAKTNDRIPCDEECAIQKRNQRLALALEIQNPNLSSQTDSSVPAVYSQFLKDYAKQNPLLISKVEHELKELVKVAQSLPIGGKKLYSFRVMQSQQRKVVHELAEFYGCETESQDEEPYRNVVATATKNKCFLPRASLLNSSADSSSKSSSSSGISPNDAKLVPTLTKISQQKHSQQASAKSGSSSSKKREPVIDYFDFNG